MGIRVDGATLSCGGCGAVVYPDCKVLASHNITRLPDGRIRWWSRDFGVAVHICAGPATVAASERVGELPADAVAAEQMVGLLLDLLAAAGVPPSRS